MQIAELLYRPEAPKLESCSFSVRKESKNPNELRCAHPAIPSRNLRCEIEYAAIVHPARPPVVAILLALSPITKGSRAAHFVIAPRNTHVRNPLTLVM